MGKSQARLYSVFIAFLVMVNPGSVRGQANHASPSERLVMSEMIVSSNETSSWCGTFATPWYGDEHPEVTYGKVWNDIAEKPAIDGIMVAEDMRCRQCHGKCEADSLRCRSQCLSERACLVHCGERASAPRCASNYFSASDSPFAARRLYGLPPAQSLSPCIDHTHQTT